ncbi:hypothetical protein B5S28_g4927 [[Candida] boidinii]|nr:hypothetical protein B5S28_g4927 [[Candida] boidinii]
MRFSSSIFYTFLYLIISVYALAADDVTTTTPGVNAETTAVNPALTTTTPTTTPGVAAVTTTTPTTTPGVAAVTTTTPTTTPGVGAVTTTPGVAAVTTTTPTTTPGVNAQTTAVNPALTTTNTGLTTTNTGLTTTNTALTTPTTTGTGTGTTLANGVTSATRTALTTEPTTTATSDIDKIALGEVTTIDGSVMTISPTIAWVTIQAVTGGITTSSFYFSQKFSSMYLTIATPPSGTVGLGTIKGTVGTVRTYAKVTASS